jgi:DNA-binding GntR family transcriptional regulator
MKSKDLEAKSALQLDLARRILERMRDFGWDAGTRISVPEMARGFGVSRSPVAAALDLLAAQGIVEPTSTRGLQVAKRLTDLDFRTVLPQSPLEELHRRMMRERSSGALAQEVSEAELLARYGVPRGVIRKLLMRFAAEGLAHRLPGHGWRFVDTLVGEQAYNESYEFRMVIECAALRSPTFRADLDQFAQIRRAHERIRNAAATTAFDGDDWFSVNASFHEGLAACSGNRFLAEAVRQQNNLRRMQESAAFVDLPVERVEQSCREHIAILDAVEAGEMQWAEDLLRRHLKQASEFRLPG